MLKITEKKRIQILDLVYGYAKGYITDVECCYMLSLIEGSIYKYKK